MGTAWKAVATDQPPDWHQAKFKEFVELKQQVGEPSPHMALAGFLTQQDNAQWNEVVWRAGVYGAPYSVLTSEAIWREWPWERMRHANRSEFRAWVERNWGGFHIRTERRMVRTPEKMTTNLLSYADWLRSGQPHGILQSQHLYSPRENYDRWYVAVEQNVMFFGRYITIRVVEFLRRFAGADAELYDIRSIGGESPVRCLSLLYPDHSVALLEHKSRQIADSLAERLLHTVQQTQPHVNHYVLAAMLLSLIHI